MSLGDERREDRGAEECGRSSLLEFVVRIRRLFTRGRRSWSRSVKSETVDVAGTGRERVEGRPRPGKEVRRMLIV